MSERTSNANNKTIDRDMLLDFFAAMHKELLECQRIADEEIAKRIDQTLAILQKEYPMQASRHQNGITADKIIITDYNNAYQYLPNGENDRRLTDTAVAQVLMNDVNGKRQAVVAFERGWLFASETPQTAIEYREKAIAKGEIIDQLGGYNPEATATHEWGHIFAQHMDNAMVNGSATAEAYWEWYKTLSKDEISRGISSYAATNRDEFEAESFLEMRMPNPRPLAVKWWDFMKKVIDEGY